MVSVTVLWKYPTSLSSFLLAIGSIDSYPIVPNFPNVYYGQLSILPWEPDAEQTIKCIYSNKERQTENKPTVLAIFIAPLGFRPSL